MLVLKVSNLNVILNGKTILENVSFSLNKGEMMAILGPNGAGKSTLLKAILGLVPYKGNIELSSGIVLGYVPQNVSFNMRIPMRVKDFIMLNERKDLEKLKEVAKLLDVEKVINENYAKISIGLKQRVLIAKAMYHGSNLILMDEPTSSLDVNYQTKFYRILKELKKQGISIIIVSHDVGIVVSYVDKVICLNRKMFYHGKPGKELNIELLKKVYGSDVGIIVHDH